MVLLVGSGLLLKSFLELRKVDPGYETADIFTFQAAPDPQLRGLSDGPALARFHYDLMERLAALPSVTSVGLARHAPAGRRGRANRIRHRRVRRRRGSAGDDALHHGGRRLLPDHGHRATGRPALRERVDVAVDPASS